MIDNLGRIKGRVSIVDIIIVLAILGVAAGFIFRQASPHIEARLSPDQEFQIVFEVNRIRSFIVDDALNVGDYLFRQHERQPLGRIIDIERRPATDIMARADGTAVLATMEERCMLLITVQATGTISERGFYVNGNDVVSPGADIMLINNRVFFPLAWVRSVIYEGVEYPAYDSY